MSAFLEGVRVLDLGGSTAPMAGHMLAKLGADVVKLEAASGSNQPSADKTGTADGRPLALDAGKRSVTCDIDAGAGRDLVLTLARGADILITVGDRRLQQQRLGWAELHKVNPRLIYVAISAFGEDGPKKDYAATDLILWAAGGALYPNRDGASSPLRISSNQAFHHASADAVIGALVALAARHRTGRGQEVLVATVESVSLATLATTLAASVGHPDYTVGGSPTKPGPGEKKSLDLSGSGARTPRVKWDAKDGGVELHLALGPAAGRFTNSLFAWLDSLGACDKRFAGWDWARTVPQMIMDGEITEDDLDEARAQVGAVINRYTKAELLDLSVRNKLTMAPVMNLADLAANDHLNARHAFTDVVDSAGTTWRMPSAVTGLSGAAGSGTLLGPPKRGEHNAEVLAEASVGHEPSVELPDVSGPSESGGRALEGLKVVDLAWVMAGPMIGRMLADGGAEVVRVESSRRIETARLIGPFAGGKVDPLRSALYDNNNAGKLGLALDMSLPEAREVVLDMAKWGDVLIESFAPGQMNKWGLDYEVLKARNPRLIVLSTALMGQTGPLSSLAGFGNVGAALSGFKSLAGFPGADPTGPFGPYTDFIAPRFSMAALMAALEHRRRTGEGMYLDISQVEAGLQFLTPEFSEYFATGRIAEPMGNRTPGMAPHGVFRCAGDDSWVAIAVRDDDDWGQMAPLVGGAATDERFRTLEGRKAAENELEKIVSGWTASREPIEIETELQSVDVPAHVVADSAAMAADPQMLHLRHFLRFPHDVSGESVVEASRFRMSDTPAEPRRAAPTFGRDNDHVLRDLLHYDEDRIAKLQAAGVLT